MINKRIISLTLALLLSFSAFGAFAFDDTDGTDYEAAVNVLSELDIVRGYEDKTFRPEGELSRGEFAAMIVRLVDTSVYTIPQEQIFSDVSKKHWAFEYVNAGYSIGYFSGYGDGTFAPDAKITFAEAVKAMVTMLGFERVAEARGGYPYGYIKVANDEELLDGISAAETHTATRGDVALLIYNCLDAPMLVQTSFGGDSQDFAKDPDRTILTEGLDCKKYEGIVTSTPVTGIYTLPEANKDMVTVGTEKFYIGKSGVDKYLGYELAVYATEKGNKKTVIFFEVSDQNEIITLDADDIDPATNLKQVIYEDGDKLRTVNIGGAQTVINGKCETFSSSADLKPASGALTLLDNNADGTIDVVFVKEYSHYVVSMVDAANMEIYDEYGKSPIRLKPNGSEIDYTIYRNGTLGKFKNIAVGSVLSVLQSRDGSYIEINIVTTPVRGEVIGIEDDSSYTIGEGTYKRSADLPDSELIELGFSGTFYLDIEGRIIRIEAESAMKNNYCYLLSAKLKTGLESILQLKVLNAKGEVTAYDAANKINVDGVQKSHSEVLTILGGAGSITQQPLRYELNSEGKISAIEIPQLTYPKTEDVLFRTGTRMFGYNVADTAFLIDDKTTTIFRVPTTTGSDEDYMVINVSNLINRGEYTVAAYEVEDVTAGCAVVYVESGTIEFEVDASENLCVLSQISAVINDDGDKCTKLEFWQSGKKSKIIANNDADVLQVDVSVSPNLQTNIAMTDLHPGDLFYYREDVQGNAQLIARIYPITPGKPIAQQNQFFISRGVSQEKAFGRPLLVKGNALLVEANGSELLYNIAKPKGAIYAFDEKTEEVKVITAADIIDYQNAGEAAPYVFIKTHTGEVGDVVLFYPNN